MANPIQIKKDVQKAKAGLERTKVPMLVKMKADKQAAKAATKDAAEKKAIDAEIKYIDARLKAAKAGVIVKETGNSIMKVIQSFATASERPVKEVERLWNQTEEKIKEQYPGKNEGELYNMTLEIVKKRLNIKDEESQATTTMASLGPTALYRKKVLPTVSRHGEYRSPFDDDDFLKSRTDAYKYLIKKIK